MTTDSIQLAKKFKNYKDYFLGVFPSNECPNPKNFKVKTCIIFNLDKSYNPGTHWTCAYNHPDYGKIYIDPFGMDANKDISKFLEKYTYSNAQFQPIDSTSCGRYCVYFLKNILNDRYAFYNLDEEPTHRNDVIVNYYFDKNY